MMCGHRSLLPSGRAWWRCWAPTPGGTCTPARHPTWCDDSREEKDYQQTALTVAVASEGLPRLYRIDLAGCSTDQPWSNASPAGRLLVDRYLLTDNVCRGMCSSMNVCCYDRAAVLVAATPTGPAQCNVLSVHTCHLRRLVLLLNSGARADGFDTPHTQTLAALDAYMLPRLLSSMPCGPHPRGCLHTTAQLPPLLQLLTGCAAAGPSRKAGSRSCGLHRMGSSRYSE
jgi:hypothetical protein